jgi:hypothetical protein
MQNLPRGANSGIMVLGEDDVGLEIACYDRTTKIELVQI